MPAAKANQTWRFRQPGMRKHHRSKSTPVTKAASILAMLRLDELTFVLCQSLAAIQTAAPHATTMSGNRRRSAPMRLGGDSVDMRSSRIDRGHGIIGAKAEPPALPPMVQPRMYHRSYHCHEATSIAHPPGLAMGIEPSSIACLKKLHENVASVVLGKPEVIRLALVTLLADGHLLLEDVPGVGKTLLAKALARSIDGDVSPHSIHTGPAAGRPARNQRVPSTEWRVSLYAGAAVFASCIGRRSEPGHAANAVGPAGSNGRTADLARRCHASAGPAVLRDCHAEPL